MVAKLTCLLSVMWIRIQMRVGSESFCRIRIGVNANPDMDSDIWIGTLWYQHENSDPDRHQYDADPQNCFLYPSIKLCKCRKICVSVPFRSGILPLITLTVEYLHSFFYKFHLFHVKNVPRRW
jgi:hypothetical protein